MSQIGDFMTVSLFFWTCGSFDLLFGFLAPIGGFAAPAAIPDAFAAGGPSTFAACALSIPMEN